MKKISDRSSPELPFYFHLYPFLQPLIRFFCPIRVVGSEHIPAEGGCLICANHFSNMDSFMIPAVIPRNRPVYFLAKAEAFRFPPAGAFLRGLGAIPVDRQNRDTKAVRTSISLLEKGKLMAIYPQGTRQKMKNPRATSVHGGAAMMAIHAHCPILPISLSTRKMKFAFFRRVEIRIGEPILPQELENMKNSGASYSKITQFVFDRICDLGNFPAVQK